MNALVETLNSHDGWTLLDRVCSDESLQDLSPLALSDHLRAEGHSSDLVSTVLAQRDLRLHAQAKFGDRAGRMLFTRDGLEQASRFVVAQQHAQRFHVAGARFVADLGCGIGTESLAFNEAGLRTFSVEIDPDTAALTAHNLSPYPTADVQCRDVTTLDLDALRRAGVDAIFADPARRTGQSKGTARVNNPESWAPPLSFILGIRDIFPSVGVKVAPGIAHEVLPHDAHVQWVSVDGNLVEAGIWCGEVALEGSGRSALVIRGDRSSVLRDEAALSPHASIEPAPMGTLSRYIAEPDDAVIRSGALSTLAARTGLHLIDPRIAYLSGDNIPSTDTEFLALFEVIDCVALRPKQISTALRKADIGQLEVKKRGADIDPATLRKAVKPQGSQAGAVIATRIAGQHRAIIAKRVAPTH